MTVDQILSAPKRHSKSGNARRLILDMLDGVAILESDELDAQVAQATGLAARTVRDLRMELSSEGLIRNFPDKDEHGTVTRWNVTRTGVDGS